MTPPPRQPRPFPPPKIQKSKNPKKSLNFIFNFDMKLGKMAPDEAGRKVTHPSGHQAALTAPPSMWGSQGRRGWFPEGGGRMGGGIEKGRGAATWRAMAALPRSELLSGRKVTEPVTSWKRQHKRQTGIVASTTVLTAERPITKVTQSVTFPLPPPPPPLPPSHMDWIMGESMKLATVCRISE